MYFQKQSSYQTDIKRFHNEIKYVLYHKYTRNASCILELSCGRANDLHKWIQNNIKHVVAVDIDQDAINEGIVRYNNTKTKTKVDFVQQDLLKKDCITNIEQYIPHNTSDVVICNFALHYFLETNKSFSDFIDIVNTFLKPNGYFIFMTLDGQKVFDLLQKNSLINNQLFQIKKCYVDNDFKDFGQKINVYIETIGSYNDEFLVNYNVILNKLSSVYNICEDNDFDCRRLNTNEKQLTMLNRYVVLQKNA